MHNKIHPYPMIQDNQANDEVQEISLNSTPKQTIKKIDLNGKISKLQKNGSQELQQQQFTVIELPASNVNLSQKQERVIISELNSEENNSEDLNNIATVNQNQFQQQQQSSVEVISQEENTQNHININSNNEQVEVQEQNSNGNNNNEQIQSQNDNETPQQQQQLQQQHERTVEEQIEHKKAKRNKKINIMKKMLGYIIVWNSFQIAVKLALLVLGVLSFVAPQEGESYVSYGALHFLILSLMFSDIFEIFKNIYILLLAYSQRVELTIHAEIDIHQYRFIALYEDIKFNSNKTWYSQLWKMQHNLVIRNSVTTYGFKCFNWVLQTVLVFWVFILYIMNRTSEDEKSSSVNKFGIMFIYIQVAEPLFVILLEIANFIKQYPQNVIQFIRKQKRKRHLFMDRYKKISYEKLVLEYQQQNQQKQQSQQNVEDIEQNSNNQQQTQQKLEDFQQQCTICIADYEKKDIVVVLECGQNQNNHFYHEKCLKTWLDRTLSCPNCRKPVYKEKKY